MKTYNIGKSYVHLSITAREKNESTHDVTMDLSFDISSDGEHLTSTRTKVTEDSN